MVCWLSGTGEGRWAPFPPGLPTQFQEVGTSLPALDHGSAAHPNLSQGRSPHSYFAGRHRLSCFQGTQCTNTKSEGKRANVNGGFEWLNCFLSDCFSWKESWGFFFFYSPHIQNLLMDRFFSYKMVDWASWSVLTCTSTRSSPIICMLENENKRLLS